MEMKWRIWKKEFHWKNKRVCANIFCNVFMWTRYVTNLKWLKRILSFILNIIIYIYGWQCTYICIYLFRFLSCLFSRFTASHAVSTKYYIGLTTTFARFESTTVSQSSQSPLFCRTMKLPKWFMKKVVFKLGRNGWNEIFLQLSLGRLPRHLHRYNLLFSTYLYACYLIH